MAKDNWLTKSRSSEETMQAAMALLQEQLDLRERIVRKFTAPSPSDVNAPPPGKRTGGSLDGVPLRSKSDHTACKHCGCGNTKKSARIL